MQWWPPSLLECVYGPSWLREVEWDKSEAGQLRNYVTYSYSLSLSCLLNYIHDESFLLWKTPRNNNHLFPPLHPPRSLPPRSLPPPDRIHSFTRANATPRYHHPRSPKPVSRLVIRGRTERRAKTRDFLFFLGASALGYRTFFDLDWLPPNWRQIHHDYCWANQFISWLQGLVQWLNEPLKS